MKYLLYASSFFTADYNASAVICDEAQRLANEDHEVVLVTCNGRLNACFANQTGNKAVCKLCRFYRKLYLKKLHKSINIVDLPIVRHPKSEYRYSYDSFDDICAIKYKSVAIGYSAMSTYITWTRNLNPVINSDSKPHFDLLLEQTSCLVDLFEQVVIETKPDIVGCFNGRIIDSRPIWEVARNFGIMYRNYELVGGYGEPFYKTYFENATPHNIQYRVELMNKHWSATESSESEKMEIGKSFYHNRRNKKPTGDIIHIALQEIGRLPVNFDPQKKNIAIFNSSEDEFAAIDESFDSLKFFNTQIEGLKFIFDAFQHHSEIHFYLRIHPNLNGINYRYHTDLKFLQACYSNVTVIAANDKVSSYDLMDASKKVIVFGSTMGMEACYWGKPVILLGPAFYSHLDICYIPDSKNELIELIQNELVPKDNLNAIKLAYSSIFIDKNNAFKYFKVDYVISSFLGHEFRRLKGQSILGSGLLFAIGYKFLKKMFSFIGKVYSGWGKMSIPLDEA